MRRTIFCIAFLLLGTSFANAQFCPAGSRQVSNGGGIMCQCPDGSFAGINGCRTVQQRPQPQAQPQPQPQLRPNQGQIDANRREMQAARQRNFALAHQPAMNKRTHAMEERRGITRVDKDGRKIWFQLQEYSGPAYVWWEEYDVYIEVPEEDYERIFDELNSGDDEQIREAESDLQALANTQDVISLY